jgi:LacI family transcriptional regulator
LRRAAKQHKRKLPKQRVVHADFTRDGGAEAMAALLAADDKADERTGDKADGKLTAIVALNDSMAVGALAALRDLKRRLAVVGFDDMPIARDVTPSLTSVRLPLTEMGERAMQLALGEPGDGPRTERVGAELIQRESTWPHH